MLIIFTSTINRHIVWANSNYLEII